MEVEEFIEHLRLFVTKHNVRMDLGALSKAGPITAC
jgi:hypothetical protein